MDNKFYETPAFKKLNAKWEVKLLKSGFNDISKPGSVSKQYFSLSSKTGFTEGYLAKCLLILESFDFGNRRTKSACRDRFIFELHVNGRSLREIEAMLVLIYPKRLRLRKTQIGKFISVVVKDFEQQFKMTRGCAL